MLNPFKEVNWKPGVRECRTFARSLIIGFPCLAVAWLLMNRFHTGLWHAAPARVLAGAGAGAGLVFLVLPGIARPFYLVWYLLACCIGFVMGNVLLSAVFYLVVTGIAWSMRAMGRRPLGKGLDRKAGSYWLDAKPVTNPARYFDQF